MFWGKASWEDLRKAIGSLQVFADSLSGGPQEKKQNK